MLLGERGLSIILVILFLLLTEHASKCGKQSVRKGNPPPIIIHNNPPPIGPRYGLVCKVWCKHAPLMVLRPPPPPHTHTHLQVGNVWRKNAFRMLLNDHAKVGTVMGAMDNVLCAAIQVGG